MESAAELDQMIAVFVVAIGLLVFWGLLRRLEGRVAQLETSLEKLRDAAAPEEEFAEVVSPQQAAQSAAPAPQTGAMTAPSQRGPIRLAPTPSPAAETAEITVTPKRPGTIETLRKQWRLAAPEWEAIIGGSWLNKLGVLVFVIGLALFVGYALTTLGALGRVATCIAVSLAMLVGGVMLERQPGFTTYARGLIGGGWAGLYFTTYAAHGIAAARVIADPALATALLITVAGGMIVHSLRYRSEVVTGLAYFGAFAALSLSALTDFAVIASLPLAGSLLYIAGRFRWHRMTIAGLAVTYGSYLLSTAGVTLSTSRFIQDQSILAIYWLLFELFDLVDAGRGPRERTAGVEPYPISLFPLNTCAFIGASLLQWFRFAPRELDIFLASVAAAFVLDAIARAVIRPPKSFEPEHNAAQRAAGGGYEGAITVAGVLAAATIFQRFSGLEIEVALLLEAEMFVLAGLGLRENYLELLGSAVFLLAAARLLLFDWQNFAAAEEVLLFGLGLSRWSLVAAITTATAYVNRRLFAERRWAEVYSYFASCVAAILIYRESPVDYLGLGWLTLGVFLFEAGLWANARDLRIQGYLTGALGALTLLVISISRWPGLSDSGQQIALTLAAAIAYGLALQTSVALRSLLSDAERLAVRGAAVYAANAFVATSLWCLLPAALVAVGWAVMMLALLYLGINRGQRHLRLQSYIMALLVFVRCGTTNFVLAGRLAGIIPVRTATAAAAVAALYAAEFMSPRKAEGGEEPALTGAERLLTQADRNARLMFALLATALLTLLLYNEVSGEMLTEAWALEGVCLLIAGFAEREVVLRFSGLLLLAICALKVFFYDLRNLEILPRILSFIVLGLLMLAVSFVYTRYSDRLRRYL